MKLLHIDTGNEMRGGQRQALLLLEGLRAAGHSVQLLASRDSALWRAAEEHGFPVRSAGLQTVWKYSQRTDLTHAHDAHGHTLAAVAARNPLVVSRRVAFPAGSGFASRWKYARAKRFLAVSRFVAEQLERGAIAKDKIDVVYDAVGVASGRPVWNNTGPIVAPANRDPAKGRDLLEQAAELAAIPVHFSEDLTRDLTGASLFVYISRSEGLGSAALLAMSMGIPVIASHTGGLPEAVVDGFSGLLVNNDSRDIAAAIRRLQSNPALAKMLAYNARLQIEGKFTLDHLLRATLASYARALGPD